MDLLKRHVFIKKFVEKQHNFQVDLLKCHVLIKKCVEKQHNFQVDLLKCHVMRGTGALVINALLDFFSYALCVPYSETTDSAHFDMLLEMLAGKLTVTISPRSSGNYGNHGN